MSSKTTDILSSKLVYKAQLFDVEEVKVKYQTGRMATHHVVRRHPTVIVFPVTDKKEIYLIKQYRYMFEQTTIEAVAGFIDPGETPMQAAKRELKEETGITAGSVEEIVKLDMSASVFDAKAHLFLARDLEFGEAQPEDGEDIELIKMPLSEAIKKIVTGEIHISATVAGLLMIERLLK